MKMGPKVTSITISRIAFARNSLYVSMQRIARQKVVAIVMLCALIFSFVPLAPRTALASTAYNASYVLGQPDFTHDDWPGEFPGLASTLIDMLHHRLFLDTGCTIFVFNLDSSNLLLDNTPDNILGAPDFDSVDCDALDASSVGWYAGLEYDYDNDRLFVHDVSHLRILVFDLSEGLTDGMDASYVLGQPDFETDDENLTQSGLGYSESGGLGYDPDTHYLYVNDGDEHHRIMVFDTTPETIENGMDASYVLGQPDFETDDCEVDQSSICTEDGGLTIDNVHHRLFVPDDNNNRVLVYDLTSLADGMPASYVLGQPDFDTSDCSSEPEGMCYPQAPTYDSANDLLYVAPGEDSRYFVFDVSTITNGELPIAVIGQTNFTDIEYPPVAQNTNAGFDDAGNAGFDPVHNRFVMTDYYFHRTLIFEFIQITNDSELPSGTEDSAYSEPLTFHQYQGTVTSEVISGALPDGISLVDNELVGTPTESGTFTFTIEAQDDNGTIGYFLARKEFTLTIDAAAEPEPEPTPPSSGGGLPPAAYTPPSAPASGSFGMVINGGANITNSPTVSLSFSVGSDTDRLALSEDPNFTNSNIEPLSSPRSYTFKDTSPGTKILYAKFYNSWGQATQPVQASILYDSKSKTVYTSPPTQVSSGGSTGNFSGLLFVGPTKTQVFPRDLALNSKGADVKSLQVFLNTHGYIVAKTGAGSPGKETTLFGSATKAALTRFQKDYGLPFAGGSLSGITREVLNRW